MINKKYIYNFFIVLSFIVLSFISIIYFIHVNYIFGAGDLQFHLRRLMELRSSFEHGNFLPLYSFNQFHGSAVMSLYPYVNLFPVVILSFIIKSPISLIYTYFGFTTFLSLVIGYYSSLSVSKSHKTSFVFSIVYSLSIPFLTYSIYDMAFGVNTVIISLPLFIFGFFDLLNDYKWLKFSFGIILIVFSHILSTIMIVGFCILLIIINYKRINRIVRLCIYKSLLFISLITSLIWLPFIKMIVNNFGKLNSPGTIPLEGTNFISLFKNSVLGYINFDLNSLAVIGLIIPLIFYKIFYSKFSRDTKQIYWLSIFMILICSNVFPWKITNFGIFKIFKIFQFTWRFYIIPEILLSYIFAVCITKCIRKHNVKYLTIILSIIITISLQIFGQKQIINEDIHAPMFTRLYISNHKSSLGQFRYHIINKAGYQTPGRPYYKITNNTQFRQLLNTNTDFSVSDYYPKASSQRVKYINNNKAIYNNNNLLNFRHDGYNKFNFNNKKLIKCLSLPLLYYNGENLRIIMNHHLVEYKVSKNDLINIMNIQKGYHNLSIKYEPNVYLLIIKYILFMIGIIWIILIWAYYIKRKYLND